MEGSDFDYVTSEMAAEEVAAAIAYFEETNTWAIDAYHQEQFNQFSPVYKPF